jgi:hypothetical protein
MNATTTFGFALWISGLFAIYLARFCLRHSQKLTSDELAERYPHLEWVKWGYPIGVAAVFWLLVAVWAIVYSLYKNQLGDRWFVLGAALMSVLLLAEGFIALLTGVYSASTRFRNLYVYDLDKQLTWIARLQIVSAIVIVAVSLAGFLVMP